MWTPWERSRRRQTSSRQLTGVEQSRAEKVWDDRWSQAAVASQLISCKELHRDTQAERPRRRRAGGQTHRQTARQTDRRTNALIGRHPESGQTDAQTVLLCVCSEARAD